MLDPNAPGSNVNGSWRLARLPQTDPDFATQLDLTQRDINAQTNEILSRRARAYSSELHPAARSNCSRALRGPQRSALLRQFKLHLPPGFLGNPTALPACPIPLSRQELSRQRGAGLFGQRGTSDRCRTDDTSAEGAIRRSTTSRRSGWNPPGSAHKIPVRAARTVSGRDLARFDNDYGLNSALVDIPKNLGGPQAAVTRSTPCSAPSSVRPHERGWIQPRSLPTRRRAARSGPSSATRPLASKRQRRSRPALTA